MKLLQGGNGARRGSERMVREKIDVALEASTSLTAGAWGEKNCPSISKTGRSECVEVDPPIVTSMSVVPAIGRRQV
jgi:hypothetical protein